MAAGDGGPDPAAGHDAGRDAVDDDRPWWEQGEEPDYRATLANERTFLAWSRTALALLAGSLAVLQLVHVAPFDLRLALACYLIAISVGVTLTGYYQWRSRQQRMRHRRPLGHTSVHALLGTAVLLLAGLVCAVAAFSTH